MNWVSVAVRAVLGFAVLFLLGYLYPGFSGFSIIHLLINGILVGVLSTLAETAFLADHPGKESTVLLVVSAATIYLYSLLLVGQRAPLVGTVLAAGLITIGSYLAEKRLLGMEAGQQETPQNGQSPEGNQG